MSVRRRPRASLQSPSCSVGRGRSETCREPCARHPRIAARGSRVNAVRSHVWEADRLTDRTFSPADPPERAASPVIDHRRPGGHQAHRRRWSQLSQMSTCSSHRKDRSSWDVPSDLLVAPVSQTMTIEIIRVQRQRESRRSGNLRHARSSPCCQSDSRTYRAP